MCIAYIPHNLELWSLRKISLASHTPNRIGVWLVRLEEDMVTIRRRNALVKLFD